MSEQKKVDKSQLNKVPFGTRVRPYLIVAPSLIITIGIMIPFVMAIWYSLTNYSFKLPTHKFIEFRDRVSFFICSFFALFRRYYFIIAQNCSLKNPC